MPAKTTALAAAALLCLPLAACDPALFDLGDGGDAPGGRGFSDDFAQDSLGNTQRYAQFGGGFGEGFVVADGVLRARSGPWETPLLDLLPLFGRSARIEFDFRWTENEQTVAFVLLADWRYRSSSPHVAVIVAPDRGWLAIGQEVVQRPFVQGQWYHVAAAREGDRFTFAVDGEQLFDVELPAKGTSWYSSADEVEYGGFALRGGTDPGTKTVEFDNLSVSGEPSPVRFAAASQSFQLGGEDLVLTALYDTTQSTWGHNQLQGGVEYMQFEYERVFGVRPIHRRLGIVWATGSEYYDQGNGHNDSGVVYHKGRAGDDGTFVNTHELAHNWYHLYGKRWSVEGTAQLGARVWWAERWRRFFKLLDFRPKQSLLDGLAADPRYMDQLLDDDTLMNFDGVATFEQIDKGYWKSEIFTWILYRMVGPDGFKRLNADAAAAGRALSSEDLQDSVERILGRDLTDVFAGWVFPGTGTFRFADLLEDTDGDGLSDLDEAIIRTSVYDADTDGDGYGDLGEANAGFSPTRAAEPASGTMLVDGQGDDWDGVAPLAQDGDDGLGDADLAGVRVLGDSANGGWFVRFDFQPGASPRTNYLTLDFGTSQDPGRHAYRVNFFLETNSSNAFDTTSGDMSTWRGLDSGRVQVARGTQNGRAFAEGFIPASMLGGEESLHLQSANGGVGDKNDWMQVGTTIALDRPLPKWRDSPWTPPAWR